MTSIRVLIVDDSVVVRRLVTNALSAYPAVSVVGTAGTGVIALAKLPQLAPDVVILDVEMPEMDGITTLRHIREQYPRLPVVMFSSLTERGASTTFDALAAGASDYVLKPSALAGDTLAGVVHDLLLPKLLALGAVAAPGLNRIALGQSAPPAGNLSLAVSVSVVPARAREVASTRSSLPPRMTPQVIAIAASTGGPNALSEVIAALPADIGLPVVVVQHMPPIFTRCLAERIDAKAVLKVLESAGGERLREGHVYIAPGNLHLEVVREADGVYTRLSSEPPENSCRPAADVLFRSVARAYGPSALAVVLTGLGQDGLLGAREIVDKGGRVLAQNRASCVVWGMPRAVEEAGLCEEIAPLNEIAAAIAVRARGLRVQFKSQSGSE